MMKNLFLLTAAALLCPLYGCTPHSDNQAQSADASSTSTAASLPASASSLVENSVQTLTSKDGKIQILIQNGHFSDISNESARRPEGVAADELTLLQYDAGRDITIYASNLGEAKTDAATYFTNLKHALQHAQGLTDIRIGAATDNRMNYRFSQPSPAAEASGKFTENCIAIHESHLYNVCASSQTASQEDLIAVLKDVNLIK